MPTILQLDFRYDAMATRADRAVMTIDIWLGAIAGLFGLIMKVNSKICGSYVEFMSKLIWFQKLYKVDPEFQNKFNSHIFDKDGNLDFSTINHTLHYIKSILPFKSQETIEIDKVIKDAEDKLNDNLNYYNLIKTQH